MSRGAGWWQDEEYVAAHYEPDEAWTDPLLSMKQCPAGCTSWFHTLALQAESGGETAYARHLRTAHGREVRSDG